MPKNYREEMEYVRAKLRERPGSFLDHFLHACLYADESNFPLLRSALAEIMVKYPAKPEFLNDDEQAVPTSHTLRP